MLTSWVFRPAAALAAAVLGARWLWLWWWPRWLGLGLLTPDLVLEALVLRPLALYESLAILPVGSLRRHAPALGGTLVVLMAMHGVLLRLFVEMLRALFARITFSRDPVVNFHAFWAAVRDHYAFLELRRVDWAFVRQLYGDAVQPATSDDDLLLVLQESLALCDDPSLQLIVPRAASVTSVSYPSKRAGSVPSGPSTTTAGRRQLAALAAQQAQARVLSIVERNHLADGGRRIANNFVCGILNAETSPGWRIGYIALTAMDGFVEFTLPRVDALMPSWTTGSGKADKLSASPPPSLSVAIPELYDLESMRWSLEAILKGLGDVDGLILDLRFNRGGGSLVSALSIASFFATETRASLAFSTDEKLPSYGKGAARFSKRRKYYIPYTKRSAPYRGPLVVLQSQYTKGTAELLCLSLMNRPQTCRIGATTAGSLSTTKKLRLPNYWTVDIPNQRCFSADGELFEGVGIPPMMEAPVLGDAPSSDPSGPLSPGSTVFDPCVKRAIDHIMNA